MFISIRESYFQKLISKITAVHVTQDNNFWDNWKYKQEMDLYKVYRKEGKIVMLGNSITYRCNWNELLNRDDVINRGIGSDTTEGFLNRLEFVYNTNPEICFIMGGINDIYKGENPKMIVNNLASLIDSLKAKNIKPVIQSILYVAEDCPNAEQLNKQIETTNQLIEKMCLSKKELFWNLNKTLNNEDYLREEYSFDGIHLTFEAYKKWGHRITQFLNDYEAKRTSRQENL